MLAGVLLAVGCKPPKYVKYASPSGDFTCEVPWGWAILRDAAGSDYVNTVFTGPFEPAFLRGMPSLSVRWYKVNAPHRLPDGSYETYSGYEDFARQMLRGVYGPDGKMWAGSEKDMAAALARREVFPTFQRVKVSGWEGYYFVVYKTLQAPPGSSFGVSRNEAGERAVLQRHAYVLLPVEDGFYALIYPATHDGFEKYKPVFFHLINSFRALKDGPAGAKTGYAGKAKAR